MSDKNIILFGGKNIEVQHDPASPGYAGQGPDVVSETVKVRQIPVREYEGNVMLSYDEPALVGFLCGKNKAWALTLTPESFDEVMTVGREVNAKGFFTFCQRLMERGTAEIKAQINAGITYEQILEAQAATVRKTQSGASFPEFVPPPVR